MSEAKAFVKDNPQIEFVDVLIYDLCGIMRGKRIPVSELDKLYSGGMMLPSTIHLMDVTGDSIDPDGRGLSDGEPDAVVTPVPGTLCPVPWKEASLAQVFTTFYEPDGSPTIDDPRHVLAGVVAEFTGLGLTPVVACELEFYLIEPRRDHYGPPIPSRMPRSGRRSVEGQVYSMAQLDDYADFLRDVAAACDVQDIPAGAASIEYAPGQFEINLNHVNDAVTAGDHAALLQRVIRGVALNYGAEATFMAKPVIGGTGNGLHIHCSLLDTDGTNVFDDGGPDGTDLLRYAVGGMLDSMGEGMPFFAPNVNSYRRFVPDSYVPMARTWAHNNRSVALRIPGGGCKARRFEHRIAGADANPYLTLAALLSGVLHGLKNRIEPPPMCEGDAGHVDGDIPRTWQAGLDVLEHATILPRYMTETYCRRYRLVKQDELDRFYGVISDREYEWYMISR